MTNFYDALWDPPGGVFRTASELQAIRAMQQQNQRAEEELIMSKKFKKITVVEQPWMLLPKKESPIVKPNYQMTIEEAMMKMQEARLKLVGQGPSALNPALSALDAWDVVWSNLLGMQGPPGYCSPKDTLAVWVDKRVRQVCANKLNPDLPDDPALLGPPPEPDPPKVPIRKPKHPFERKFS